MDLVKKHFTLIGTLLVFFTVTSWPFLGYPLTDGDIAHWTGWAREIQLKGNYLSAASDQCHGPLLAWTAAPLLRLIPRSFYLLNFFNLMSGVLGVFLTYVFARAFWRNQVAAEISTVVFATSLAPIYFSRTPMYDWPAAMFYFAFCGLYYLYLRDGRKRLFVLAVLCLGIASLSRFSMSLGLGGIYMLLLNRLRRESLLKVVSEGLCLAAAVVLINAPWVLVQAKVFGNAFLGTFFWDNVGRFATDSAKDAYHFDFYGFTIYALLGIFPYTFPFLGIIFRKNFWIRVWNDEIAKMLLAGFLPCLLLFSFSGHTKLARYISFVFPYLLLFFSYYWSTHFLPDAAFRRRSGRWLGGIALAIFALIFMLIFQFPTEARQSLLFVAGVVVLLVGLLGLAWWVTTRRWEQFLAKPGPFLLPYAAVYLCFFSVLAHTYQRAPFLLAVRETILKTLQ